MAGKVSSRFLRDSLLPNLTGGEELLWGPVPGGDFAAVDLGDGRALATACDPLAISPQLGWKRSAWLAFHLVATDVAVSGLRPTYLTAGWTVPEAMAEQDLAEMLQAFHREARTYEVQVIAGHTGRYHGASYPWVGAATVTGIGRTEDLRLPSSAQPGDPILLWGTPGLEAAVLLTLFNPDAADKETLDWAQNSFRRLSAMEAALRAAPRSGIRCLHDITEGGLLGALSELASAMGRGVELDSLAVPADRRVSGTLARTGLSSWEVTSCGSLLAVVAPDGEDALLQNGFRTIGWVRRGRCSFVRSGGTTAALCPPEVDPLWDTYAGRWPQKEGT